MLGPRIVFVINADFYFLLHFLELARASRDAGAEVIVAAPDSGRAEAIRREGFGFVCLPMRRSGTNPFYEAWTLACLVRLYRRFSPELVHHVGLKSVLYGSLAARLVSKMAVVNGLPGLGYLFTDQDRAPFLRMIVENLLRVGLSRKHSVTVFQNSDDLAFFEDVGLLKEGQAALIRGAGVDCARFLPVPEPDGAPVALLPARMLWDKGVGEFVAAARLVRSGAPHVRFALVGGLDPGNPAGVPEKQLAEWTREGVVEWWGHQEDMPRVFAKANLIVLPTYREGMPTVLAEGAAMGRALIAADVPGCREIVRPGVNGLLVPPRNAGALADAVRELLASPQTRARFAQAGRQIAVAEFAREHLVGQTLQLYRRLLGDRWPEFFRGAVGSANGPSQRVAA
jgi:glycosyltransferase involved in cell wall biosynthesis